MNKKLGYIFAVYFSCFWFTGFSQYYNTSNNSYYEDDAALWLNVYLEKKLSKHFDAHINHKSRISNNISKYSMGYLDFGFSYNYNKNIRVLLDYVFAKRLELDETYSDRHQFYVALVLKKKIGQWTFNYRNMFQAQIQKIFTSYDGKIPEYYDRNKLTVKYDINKRFVAYVAEELYYPLKQNPFKGLDRSRSYVGMFYNLSKKSSVEAYFLYQHELNAFNRTNRDFIYGIGYSHEF